MECNRSFWLSYDLGIKGDYPGLYAFLDSLNAKECGDGVAFFRKNCGDDFLNVLKEELGRHVKIAGTDRFYLIYIEKDTNQPKGKFLFGSRKRSSWEGYFVRGSSNEEDS